MLPVETAFKIYVDRDGNPLDNGYIYFGQANQNPVTAPVQVYWDSAGTQPASQPLRTLNGYIVRNGTPANVFFTGSYSQLVRDKSQRQIYYAPTSDDYSIATTVVNFITNLASSSGSSLIGWIQAGVGAVLRLVQDKLRERVTPEDYGMVANDASAGVANSVAMNKLVAYATANGACIRVPSKTYYIAPNLAKTDEAGSNLAAIEMLSNLHIRADKGAVFKIPNGISSDATPTRFSMFFSNQVLSNISIVGLTIDMNGQNNPMSPARPASYNLFTQAHILFSGTPGGIAARGDDVHIERCTFLNTPGVTCIGCAQSNSLGVTLGKRWKILFNTFLNNGLDTNDHSSVYIWANEVHLIGNTFTADTMQGTVGGTGGLAAWECHGANIIGSGNTVKNYYRGCYVAPNYSNDAKNVVITGNSFGPLRGTGVELERIQANTFPVYNIIVSNNVIELTDDTVAISYKPAVLLNTVYEVTDVTIQGNQMRKTGTVVASAFMGLAATTVAGQEASRIKISDNQAVGATFGVILSTNTTCGLGDVTISDNKFFQLTGAGAFASPAGISGVNIDNTFTTAVRSLTISDNSFIDTRNVPLAQYGIILSGKITNLDIGFQNYAGNTIADYTETNIQVTNRQGFFNATTFTPVWNAGTPITLGNGTQAASYTLRGDQVTVTAKLTVGSTTTFPGGALFLTAPYSAKSGGLSYHGNWRIFDSSASIFRMGLANIDSTSSNITMQLDNTGGNITQASPVPLATGDVVSLQMTYTKS